MIKKEEQIKLNLEILDVNFIHKVLSQNDIKWTNPENGDKRIPTIQEIETVAEHCMREACKSDKKYHTIGGFEAEVIDGLVEIKFVLTKANLLSKLLG